MKLVSGNIRKMREELAKAGAPKDTDEIREGYVFGDFNSNITLIPVKTTQNEHKHFMLIEINHVLSGEMQYSQNGNWSHIEERQAAYFDLGEYHNMRTYETIKKPVLYPNATENIGAVFHTSKFIPPYINVYQDEIPIVLNNDWFGPEYEKNPTDQKTSPLLRAEEKLQKKFWEIVNRNKPILKDYHTSLYK